jgi:hypothetical protein
MSSLHPSGTEGRREAVRTTLGADGRPVRNGIDYLEVTSPDQRTLEVTFIHPLPGEGDGVPEAPPLSPAQVVIQGGIRVRGIQVLSVTASGRRLAVEVDRAGDFSPYTLRLVASPASEDPPEGFDSRLSEVAFSFKAGCPSAFDCAPASSCLPEEFPSPDIDYLAKDFGSFRRLMLDRLAVTIPDWRERSPADLGVVLVELLAYAADHLSYHQDAVATEAYLGTARKRTSVRRHARLLDYRMHDGASARAWVALQVDAGADGVVLPGPRTVEEGAVEDRPGTLFLTRSVALPTVLDEAQADQAIRAGAEAFEATHDLVLRQAGNEIHFHTWGEEDVCLPRGATSAWLRNPGDGLAELAPGQILVFEEVRGPESGRPEDADPAHRHAVRLTGVEFTEDPLFPEVEGDPPEAQRLRVVRIRWGRADALPFPLCLASVPLPADPTTSHPVSVARGNVVLVEHGLTHPPVPLPPVPLRGSFRPELPEAPVAMVAPAPAPGDSARRSSGVDPRSALAAVRLREEGAQGQNGGRLWLPAPDLLESDGFDPAFVVEVEEGGRAALRFGDGVQGRAPIPGTRLHATCRVGGGRTGNVGGDAIRHVRIPEAGILSARNPLPAGGGEEPEPLERVRMDAPQAFRRQERAVTEEDYAEMAERHPEVQKAAATFRWTGSWHTAFVTVDRRGGRPVDDGFRRELTAFLEHHALAGHDLVVDAPRFVPLDLAFTVCVAPGYLRAQVRAALLETFSSGHLPGGGRGFFHPDEFSFGDSVFVSQVVAAALDVPGVLQVDGAPAPGGRHRFQRWGEPARGEWAEGRIRMDRLEIPRLDNDPARPEHGHLEFYMEGGA